MRGAWAVTSGGVVLAVLAVLAAAVWRSPAGAVAAVVSLVLLGAGSGAFGRAVRERWEELPRRAQRSGRAAEDDQVLNGEKRLR